MIKKMKIEEEYKLKGSKEKGECPYPQNKCDRRNEEPKRYRSHRRCGSLE
jgi:hypothetical protein